MLGDTDTLQRSICASLCADVKLVRQSDDRMYVSTPFQFDDGDEYGIYLERLASGGIRVTDCGTTLMHLSYLVDADALRTKSRGRLLESVVEKAGATDDRGEIFIDGTAEDVATNIFRLGQLLTQIRDLEFLRRVRSESTFYNDLETFLRDVLPQASVTKDYIHAGMEHAKDYPIDFRIEGKSAPLFLFGVPGKDKARLATIILEHLLREAVEFDSILVFADQEGIPRADVARLSNVGGEMVSSLSALGDLKRKVLRRAA